MVERAVAPTPTILLYSPHAPGDLDLEAALVAAGYRVVRSATIAGCLPPIEAGCQLAILDDPPWELARGLVTALDAAALPMPRIWISTWSSAPSLAGKLGVDALLLDRDVGVLLEQVQRTLSTWQPASDEPPASRRPIRRATTAPELHPSGFFDRPDDDTSDGWP